MAAPQDVLVVQGDLSTLGERLSAAEVSSRERRRLFRSAILADEKPHRPDSPVIAPLARAMGAKPPKEKKEKKKRHKSSKSKEEPGLSAAPAPDGAAPTSDVAAAATASQAEKQDAAAASPVEKKDAKSKKKHKHKKEHKHKEKKEDEKDQKKDSTASGIVMSLFSLLPGEKDFTRSKVPGMTDLSDIATERAVRHCYDPETMSWSKKTVVVKIDPFPFASGGMRKAHYTQIWDVRPGTWDPMPTSSGSGALSSGGTCVAKFVHVGITQTETQLRAMYFQDVEQQMIAKYYAAKYNKYRPPKRVDFVEASLLELLDRQGGWDVRLCGVEQYIFGHYCKWNNNCGFVHENTRNTPQAFSHFTYEASNHTILVCDIQGVGDLYTDPVIHTRDSPGTELYSGNLGLIGIEQFLMSHRCNPLCKTLGLPPICPSEKAAGTRFPQAAGAVEITRRDLPVDKLGALPSTEAVPSEAPLGSADNITSPLLHKPGGASPDRACACCVVS